MNVSTVNTPHHTSHTASVSSAGTSSASSEVTSSVRSVDGAPPPPNGGGISKGGELMKKLSDLASSDPDKFKKVTGQIASQLETLAHSETRTDSRLTELADKFGKASASGTMDALRASGPPSGGPPPRGAHAYAQNSATHTNPMQQIDQVVESALSGV